MNSNEFEKMVQEKINQVAKMLIEMEPEIAKNEPKRIGQMAKMIVFDALNEMAG